MGGAPRAWRIVKESNGVVLSADDPAFAITSPAGPSTSR
jgi:hypothetical protein